MEKISINNKVEEIIFSKVPTALEMIQEELASLGCDEIDVTRIKDPVCRILKEYYSEDEGSSDDENVAEVFFNIGETERKVPNSIAVSMCLSVLREHLNNFINGPLKDLENIQDKKSEIWAKNVCGKDEVDIDYKNLQVIRRYPQEITQYLSLANQVMEFDPVKLRKLIKDMPDDVDGEKAFIRDLGWARLECPEFEELLKDLQEAQSEDVLKQVVMHPVVAESKHGRVISFLVGVLKEKLKFGLSENLQSQPLMDANPG